MSRLKTAIDRYFGQDALEWFDRSYLTDWTIVGLIWFLAAVVAASPVFKRDFLPTDPEINHPHTKNQVGSFLNQIVALLGPLLVFIVVGCIKRSLLMIHHGAVGICAARGLAQLVTEALKHSIGRLRPDFLARCKWDDASGECTGDQLAVLDGRKSFPSGHSSTAFSGMLFLSLWIAGQTAAWCFSVPRPPRSLRASRMLAFFLTLLPLFWATQVAVTRIQDYRHHKEDVIVGTFIGCVSALLFYLVFWPNPFSPTTFDHQVYEQPRLLYSQGLYHRTRNTDFELSRLETDDPNVV